MAQDRNAGHGGAASFIDINLIASIIETVDCQSIIIDNWRSIIEDGCCVGWFLVFDNCIKLGYF